MTRSTESKEISGTSSGPTLGELKTFVEKALNDGAALDRVVSVSRTPHYNQFDVGEWRLKVGWQVGE